VKYEVKRPGLFDECCGLTYAGNCLKLREPCLQHQNVDCRKGIEHQNTFDNLIADPCQLTKSDVVSLLDPASSALGSLLVVENLAKDLILAGKLPFVVRIRFMLDQF
jgi:hypothetical protein